MKAELKQLAGENFRESFKFNNSSSDDFHDEQTKVEKLLNLPRLNSNSTSETFESDKQIKIEKQEAQELNNSAETITNDSRPKEIFEDRLNVKFSICSVW